MPSTRLLTALIVALVSAPLAAFAADPPPSVSPITYSEARARIVASNETMQAAREEGKERKDEKSAVSGLYWPKVELHAKAAHLNDTIYLDLDPIRDVINSLHHLPDSVLPSF